MGKDAHAAGLLVYRRDRGAGGEDKETGDNKLKGTDTL